jgi:hypothetical protein
MPRHPRQKTRRPVNPPHVIETVITDVFILYPHPYQITKPGFPEIAD